MKGVIQRPASRAAYVRRQDDQTEVYWRNRLPIEPKRAGRRNKGRRELLEALCVVAAVAVLAVLAALHTWHGGSSDL
jgi:hypothetical protein